MAMWATSATLKVAHIWTKHLLKFQKVSLSGQTINNVTK